MNTHDRDLRGRRVGRLVVVADSGRRSKRGVVYWLCRCDCGVEKAVAHTSLYRELTRSCGCLKSEVTSDRQYRHGLSRRRIYRAYHGMIGRCHDPKSEGFRLYGARGITVCQRWRGEGGFSRFLDDMGLRPSPRHSIDRIDPNGNYEPANCRWATPREQINNRRCTVRANWKGTPTPISEIAAEVGMAYEVLRTRLAKGMSIETATTKPFRRSPRKNFQSV